jgi:hypothetical protein
MDKNDCYHNFKINSRINPRQDQVMSLEGWLGLTKFISLKKSKQPFFDKKKLEKGLWVFTCVLSRIDPSFWSGVVK